MRKIFKLMAMMALALFVAAPLQAAEDCKAVKPDDFSSVNQHGLYGSWVVEIYTQTKTTLCAHLVLRQNNTLFWALGPEMSGRDVIRPGDPAGEIKGTMQVHPTGFMFHPNETVVIGFFASLYDGNILSGQLIRPSDRRGLQMTAKRAVVQQSKLP